MYITLEHWNNESFSFDCDVFLKILNEVGVPFNRDGCGLKIPYIKGNKYTTRNYWRRVESLYINLMSIAERNKVSIFIYDFVSKDIENKLIKKTKELLIQYPYLYNIGTEIPVKPSDSLPSMGIPYVNGSKLLVVGGRAPIWRYGFVLSDVLQMRKDITVIAFFDPRLGVVVVHSTLDCFEVGEVLDIEF